MGKYSGQRADNSPVMDGVMEVLARWWRQAASGTFPGVERLQETNFLPVAGDGSTRTPMAQRAQGQPEPFDRVYLGF